MIDRAVFVAAAIGLCAGCPSYEAESEIYLQRITATPPAVVANVDHSNDDRPPRITLSEGTAMGLGCTEYCAGGLGSRLACEDTKVTIAPESVAQVRDAFMLNGRQGTLVLIGRSPGFATLEITSECASATYQVTVEPL